MSAEVAMAFPRVEQARKRLDNALAELEKATLSKGRQAAEAKKTCQAAVAELNNHIRQLSILLAKHGSTSNADR